MSDDMYPTGPDDDGSQSFYDAAMDLETCNMSDTLLNTDANQWCISCRTLKQTIEKMQDDYNTNYKMLKVKIMSTNDLIKRYNYYKMKCDECDTISRKLSDTEKRLDTSVRAHASVMTRLTQAVDEHMPLKEMKTKLEKKVKFQEKLITELQDQASAVQPLQTQLNALKKESEKEKGKLVADYMELKQQHKQALVSKKKGDEKLAKTVDNLKTLKQQLSAAQKENKRLGKENEKLQLKLSMQQNATNKPDRAAVGKRVVSDRTFAQDYSRSPAVGSTETDEDLLDMLYNDVGLMSDTGPLMSPLPPSPLSSLDSGEEDSSDEELGNEVARLFESEEGTSNASPVSMFPIYTAVDLSDDVSDSDEETVVPFRCSDSSMQQPVAVFAASPVNSGMRRVLRPTAIDGGIRKRVDAAGGAGICSMDVVRDEEVSCDRVECLDDGVKMADVKCEDLDEGIGCDALIDTEEQICSVDTVEQAHSDDTVEQTHSDDTVEQTHSDDTVEQTHSDGTVEQTHSADTVEQTHSNDTVEQTHSDDTVEQTHSADTVEQAHSDDTVEQTHLSDTVEQTHSGDTVEQTHLDDTVEQMHSDDTVEQTHSDDTVEQTHSDDTVEQTQLADTMEETHSAATVEQTHSDDTVEQTHSADTVEQMHSGDTVKQTHSYNTVEQTLLVDTIEQTYSDDTVEQTHSDDTFEQTHSNDTVEQTHSAFSVPPSSTVAVKDVTITEPDMSSATPPETMHVLPEVTPPMMQTLPNVTSPTKQVLPEATHPAKPVLSEVTPPAEPVPSEVTPPGKLVVTDMTPPTEPVLSDVTRPTKPVLSEVTPPAMPVLLQVTPPVMPVLPQMTPPKTHTLVQSEEQTFEPPRTKEAAPSPQSEKTSSSESMLHQPSLKVLTRQARAGALGRKPKTVLLANKDVAKAKTTARHRQQVPQNAPAAVKGTSVASTSAVLTPAAKTKKSKKHCLPTPLRTEAIGSLMLDNDTDLLDSLLDLPRPLSPLPLSPTHTETATRRFFPELEDDVRGETAKESSAQPVDGCQTVQGKASFSVGKQQKKAGKRRKAQSDVECPAKKGCPASNLVSRVGPTTPGYAVIDVELQMLLRGSVLPATTATNISRAQPAISAELLVDCVTNILYTSKADMLSAVYSYCTAQQQQLRQHQQLWQLWQPFLTADEHQILELLLHLKGQGQFLNILEVLHVKILTILHSNENIVIPGRAALCRLFTAVSRTQDDSSRVRVLAYNAVRHSFHAFPRMILAIASVWPEALKAGRGEERCVMRCLQYIVYKNLQETKVSHCQMWQCLTKLCWWQRPGNVQEAAAILATAMIDKLLHSVDEAQLYDCEKALELMSLKEGWQWTNNHLIIKLIWPVLQQWATGGQHSFSDRAIERLLRILGVVTFSCPLQYASAAHDILQTLQALLGQNVNAAVTVCDTIQEAVLEALMLLAPFKPDLSAHACYTWVKQRQKQHQLRPHVKSKIHDFVEHYKVQFKYLAQLTNML